MHLPNALEHFNRFDRHIVLYPVIESAFDCPVGIHLQDLYVLSKPLKLVGAQAIDLVVCEARKPFRNDASSLSRRVREPKAISRQAMRDGSTTAATMTVAKTLPHEIILRLRGREDRFDVQEIARLLALVRTC